MSTNDPMTQERLDAIRERVDAIQARWDAMTLNDSWCSYPWPDPTSERIKELEKENAELRKRLTVDEDMVERAALAVYEEGEEPGARSWDNESEVIRGAYRQLAIAVLDAALNPGEGS